MPQTCPFCGEAVFSITTRRLTQDITACRTCGDKILPILNQVSNELCTSIIGDLHEDPDGTLSSVLRNMLEDQLNIYVTDPDVRRRLEASL